MQMFLLYGVVAVLVAILALLAVGLRRKQSAVEAAENKYQAMELLAKNMRQQQQALAKQFNELRAASVGMSEKLAQLSVRFDDLAEKHHQLEEQKGEGRLYSRAGKLVELGADLEELMEECELPKAEAELLMNIRKQRLSR
ncbi:MAG: DUF2802 domain-containing protein [Vibrionaceae bacterium]